MKLSNQHKAALITFFISASVVMSLFAMHIKKKTLVAETYYELEPDDPITEEQVKELEEQIEALKNGQKAETNEAFNETQQRRFAQAYKLIEPPKDYIPQQFEDGDESASTTEKVLDFDESKKINQEELDRFKKANEILKQQQEDGANSASTSSYSLVNREKLYIPTPVYLCEEGGKIVINITVNSGGEVIETTVNNSYISVNECLKEHALGYAKRARFTSDASKTEQLGTITFLFIGKQ